MTVGLSFDAIIRNRAIVVESWQFHFFVINFFFYFFSFIDSFHFADTISKALGIPKWRLFMIRTEKANSSGCMKVKFAIIGNGT